MPLTADQLGLAVHAQRFPDKTALVVGRSQCTFGELDSRCNRLAHALRSIGVGVGDTVAAVMHNDRTWVELLNAVGKVGALLVPVGYRAKGPEIEHMLRDSAASAVVVDAGLVDELAAAPRAAEIAGERIWVVGDDDRGIGMSYESVLAAQPAGEPADAFVGGGYNVLVYTAGTTGRPRAVERKTAPDRIHLASLAVAQMWDLDEREIHLAAAPLYHTAPGAYAQLHVLIGATTVLMRHFDAYRALSLIDEHRVTNAFMVPTHLARILQLDREERTGFDLSSVRLLMHSAAPCPVHVKRGAMALFPPGVMTEFYGSSESGFTRISAQEWLEKPGSVGRPWPEHEIRIMDEFGRPCAPGDVGLIYVRSPRLDFRYREGSAVDEQVFRDGFFTAGDLGYLDDDGYLFIADRRTDLIISGGANVYACEVENVLSEHAAVADVAVIGIPDDELGKSVLAVVEARQSAAVDPSELIGYARDRLARYKCPTRVELVAELPREPNGKIRKLDLVARYWPHPL